MTTNRMGLTREQSADSLTDGDLENGIGLANNSTMANVFRELLAYRKADKWISLDDQMPDDETVILVADENGVVWCAEVQDGKIYPDDWAGINGFGSREITRCKALPVAPSQRQSMTAHKGVNDVD